MSVLKHWIFPLILMGSSALGLGVFLGATAANGAVYFAAVTFYAMLCGAYIVYLTAREDHPQPIRRALRRAREARDGS